VFHLDCLRLWLQEKQDCPTCRADIPVDVPLPGRRRPPRGGAPHAPAQAEAAEAAALAAAAAAEISAAAEADAAAAAPADVGAEWAARGGEAPAGLLRPPLDPRPLDPPLAPALTPAFALPTPPLPGAPFPGSPFGGAPFPGSSFGSFAGSPFGGSPFGSVFSAPFGQAAPTLLKVLLPAGAPLMAHPGPGAAETRRVPCGAVLVVAAHHLEPGASEPSFYATPEGDWLAAGGLEVLRPPPASSSVFAPPFPATPFGSRFGALAAPGAEVVALAAEVATLRAMVQALQKKEGGSAVASPKDATSSTAAEAASAVAPAGGIAGSAVGGAAEAGCEGLRRRKPAAEVAADA